MSMPFVLNQSAMTYLSEVLTEKASLEAYAVIEECFEMRMPVEVAIVEALHCNLYILSGLRSAVKQDGELQDYRPVPAFFGDSLYARRLAVRFWKSYTKALGRANREDKAAQ